MTDLKRKILDEELSQSKARVAMCEVSLFIFLIFGKLRHHEHSDTLSNSLMTIVGYLAFALPSNKISIRKL